MTVPTTYSPRISVVCPTHNSAAFIERTVETILAQTRLPDEIVLVDDGSTDGTVAIITAQAERHPDIRWRILTGERRGPGAARNRGILAATGDWIAFLDSDDLWLPSKLEAVERFLGVNSHLNVVWHGEIHRKEDGSERPVFYGEWWAPEIPLPRQLYRKNLFSTSALVCRRELLLNAGLFDVTLSSAQDYDLWLKLAPTAQAGFLQEILGVYILRMGSISNTRRIRRTLNQYRIALRHRGLGSMGDVAFKLGWITVTLARDLFSQVTRNLERGT